MKALDLAVQELPRDVPAGTSEQPVSFSARRADALALVAESFLAHGAIEAAGAERYQIVVHVAEETLRDRTAGCCEFEHGPSMPAETARRLSCDASVVALVENDDGEPLNVGRKTRTISAPLQTRPECARQGLPFSRLREHALHRRASRRALGQRRRDEAIQSRLALPVPPSRRARRRHSYRDTRRRRIQIREAERRRRRQHLARLHTAARRLDAVTGRNACESLERANGWTSGWALRCCCSRRGGRRTFQLERRAERKWVWPSSCSE